MSTRFEDILVQKIFILILLFFTVFFGLSTFVHIIYPIKTDNFLLILLIRLFALTFNTSIIILRLAKIINTSTIIKLPTFVIIINIMFSLLIQITGRLDFYSGSGTYLITSMTYLLLFALFSTRFWYSLLLGVFMIFSGVLLFVIFPDTIYTGEIEIENLKIISTLILFFGILYVSLISALKNFITKLMLDRLNNINSSLEQLAFYDNVTELSNGLQLEKDLTSWIELNITQKELCIMGFRLDGLDVFNEILGIEKTNTILRKIVTNISVKLSVKNMNNDFMYTYPKEFKRLYRAEGNIFVFMFYINSINNYELLEESFKEIIKNATYGENSTGNLTFQGGYTSYPNDSSDIYQLWKNILNMLHKKTENAAGRFSCFNPEKYLAELRKNELIADLENSIINKEIQVAFQPKIEIKTGKVHGFEALARWTSSTHGIISPVEFITLAEHNGLIEGLTEIVIEKVFAFIYKIEKLKLQHIQIAVNLSPEVLNNRFLDWLHTQIMSNGLGTKLEIEITEGILMNVNNYLIDKFNQLRSYGVNFSIDDFGTGYSNLGYLQKFEAEILKIDKQFIDGIPHDEKNAKLVRAILQMAKSFDMIVVAEGVEYKEQRDFLETHDCDLIQGYFYSKPLSPEIALEYLIKH
jgi:EAL domain-containing protein (putative c-di-GMP-specific phosphodiesterase class I)/GGDEF domain-containing protein